LKIEGKIGNLIGDAWKSIGSRLLAAEGEWGSGQVWVRGVSEVKQYPSGSG